MLGQQRNKVASGFFGVRSRIGDEIRGGAWGSARLIARMSAHPDVTWVQLSCVLIATL
jgi:hypothetical protein